ncbi:ATP-binding cassette domain-containing protein [Nitrospira defluvii]|uniref:ABC-type transport system, ATPase and permease component n=1 Tax=Nitrospira defluvii TaxID=330214 RepID=A0ABN7M0V0_9BACT|nr:ABC transporter ATP-binding protein [Nitrospira defluvii]CAE6771001.1 Putative ABC-type transport system, ATPase and permease component [Nitrospira defluvii]
MGRSHTSSSTDSLYYPQYQWTSVLGDIFAHLSFLLKLERPLLGIIASYAVAIGFFLLCVPIAVQELVSTFSFAMEPRMIFTLTLFVASSLTGVAAFRVLQARAVETLQQRIYTRIALGFTRLLPRLRDDTFAPQQAHRFMEADLLTRALVAMVADLFNVAVVGTIGVTMLILFHPFFVLYILVLILGFVGLLTIFGRGGFVITLEMSRLHYQIFGWIQNIAHNLPHLRAAGDSPYLLERTDALTQTYVRIRQRRSNTLTGRQYKAAALWQVVGHSGLIITAGLLVVEGQLTVGQFAAAELLVGNLLLNMDTLARRMVAMFFAFVSCREMAAVFSLPTEEERAKEEVPAAEFGSSGIRLTCRNLSCTEADGTPIFQNVSLDVAPGEKIAVLCSTNRAKTALAKILAGLHPPTTGYARYNDMNLVEVKRESISRVRGLVLDSHPTLLDGTLEDNITLGRPTIDYQDLQWALRFVELDGDIDALPHGLNTPVSSLDTHLSMSQILRLLVARAIVTRPQLLIFDGTLHNMLPATREVLLRRLCAKDEPWSVVFISNDPTFSSHVDRRVILA